MGLFKLVLLLTSIYLRIIFTDMYWAHQRVYGKFMSLYSCLMHTYGTAVSRTATMVAPLLLTSGPVRYGAVLHSSEQAQWGTGTEL